MRKRHDRRSLRSERRVSWWGAITAPLLCSCGALLGFEDRELQPAHEGEVDGGALESGALESGALESGAPGAPEDLVIGQQTPTSIAIDGERVYWLNRQSADKQGAIMAVSRAGLGPPTALVGGITNPFAMTTDAVSVYFTWNSTNDDFGQAHLDRRDKAGGASKGVLLTSNSRCFGLAVFGGRAYTTTSGGTGGAVVSAAIDGTVRSSTVTQIFGTVIAVDASRTYVGRAADIVVVGRGAMGPFSIFTTTAGAVTAIAVDETHVYWTDSSNVRRLAKDSPGMAPTELATDQQAPSALALDDTHIYWTNAVDGRVQAVPKDATPGVRPIVFAVGEGEPRGIAVDAKGVFWTNYADGRVRVVRR